MRVFTIKPHDLGLGSPFISAKEQNLKTRDDPEPEVKNG